MRGTQIKTELEREETEKKRHKGDHRGKGDWPEVERAGEGGGDGGCMGPGRASKQKMRERAEREQR